MRVLDLKGLRFGRLMPLKRIDNVKSKVRWLCRCDCGAELAVKVDALRSGNTKSCGCAKIDGLIARTLKHGNARAGAKTSEYTIWKTMKDRCFRPANPRFKDWGGRGITVCARWRDSFGAFLADMGPRPSTRHSIDRIDNDGNYEPGNCRWATGLQQAANKRRKTSGVQLSRVIAPGATMGLYSQEELAG
jgi:hypothetical protein